jgi:RNA polymerase subunit RPABC4/transcription elongation factor Spt4
MAKKKVCKICKCIVEESVEECPNCTARSQWNTSFQGRAYIFNSEKSFVGSKLGSKTKGEFAIKSRS